MLKYLSENKNNFNIGEFLSELIDASKYLGVLEAKITGYKFNSVLMPMLHSREAIASMDIEGTQTTITDVLEDELNTEPSGLKKFIEYRNHVTTLKRGEEYLKVDQFSNEFIQKMHFWMLTDVFDSRKQVVIGRYKQKNNFIANSLKKIVFEPPAFTETKKYMDDLVHYMNHDTDGTHPLIKSAIIHSQFESIHPFDDGNGRVGRALVSLYMYKAKLIASPYFYLSEAINQDKLIYYRKLDSSRKGDLSEWIAFFLRKIIVQAKKHIEYIDALNELYEKTKMSVSKCVNSPKFDGIMGILFKQPVLTSRYLAEHLNISSIQANRYLDTLERNQILYGNDRKRNRLYYFMELLELMRR